MASSVIDLTSSSPPRDVLPPRQVSPQPTRPAVNTRLACIEIHSDDFLSSGEESIRSITHEDGRRAKRPRLSDQISHEQDGRPSAPTIATTSLQANRQKSTTLLHDSIEYKSSIEAADPIFPSPLAANKTSLKSNRIGLAVPGSGLFLSSDPFASPPPPRQTTAIATYSRITKDLSSDPFASSPPVRGVSEPAHAISDSTKPREPVRPLKTTVASWDPISSSAPCSSAPQRTNAPSPTRKRRSPSVISIGDSSDASSDADLPAIGSFDLSQSRPSYHDYLTTTAPKTKSKTKPKGRASEPRQGRPRQTIDPGQRAAAKALEKEQKRQEREQAKQERQRKIDIAAAIVEVNKARGDRKVSTKEMIVDIPTSLDSTIKVQLETLLNGLEVQHQEYTSPANNVIKWRRKVNSQFDDESGQWVPLPLRIEKEHHALVVMTAEEIVQLAVNDGLDEHMRLICRHFSTAKLIFVLQGVATWIRKNRNLRNRQFAAGVRSQQDDSQTVPGRRRANEQTEHIDEEVVEDAILRLQLEHNVLIHHTAIPLETAQWVSIFTQNISTIPYKKQKDKDTAGARFCMDSGQVKTGENTQDTYVRMLQEIFRVTAPIAYGVASEFGSVTKLVAGLETQGPNALEQVRKSANRDGAYSDRTIGQAVSKRLYKIFTGTDEASTDI